VLVDWFSPADLVGVDLPINRSVIYPYALAVKRDGTLLVACGTVVLALDRRWQVTGLPAKRLTDEGNYNFAYSMAMTRADTIYLRSTDGAGMWAFADGASDYRRIRAEGQPGSAFGVLDDGTPFVAESQAVRVYRNGSELRFQLPEGMSAIAASAGPDDTIWVADTATSVVTAFSVEGTPLKRFHLDLKPGQIVMRMRVLPDGGLLAATMADVRRFDAAGRTVWTWNGSEDGISMSFSTYTDVALGDDGIVYVNDMLGKRVLRLAERPSELPPDLAAVAAAGRAIRRGGDRPELVLALADAYESMGAVEAARAALERYLDERPADARATGRKLGLESSLLKAKARSAQLVAMDLLARFGAETARDAYGRAMRTWESLRAGSGDDEEIRAAMTGLRTAFQAAERGTEAARPSPKVESAELAALFPALIRSYRTKPAGSIFVRNTLSEPIRNVRADLYIKKYMDFPAEGPVVPHIDPGDAAGLDIFALLNEEVLEVQEDLPLQAQVTIRYTDARGERSIELSRPVMLYRRTAITWDDTAKLAAFITPNEDSVTRMAFEMVGTASASGPVSRTFATAARICDSLGALPLTYIKDPQSPIDAVLGTSGSVDTVRFPRTTLAYRGGDCDDTTALLASLLEAVGIPTAIMTSPGHVFVAFDTGESTDNAWLFIAPGFRTVQHKGTLWIPVESTVLSDGFADAWWAASDLVERHAASGDLGFLAVADARATYPSLPLSPSTLPAPAPDAKRFSSISKRSSAILDTDLYKAAVRAIEGQRKTQGGGAWNRTGNRLAQLHARFGRDDLAEAVLSGIVGVDPAYLPALLNLAGLAARTDRKAEALAWLRRAAAVAPGSASVSAWIKAAGFSGELGFGAAIVETQPAVVSTDRASAPGVPAWVDE
jgi:tetratricopeptide (TPR) repeat protein